MTELLINKNKLTNIQAFAESDLSNFNAFLIHNNQITSIEPFDTIKFKELRMFYLYGNRVSKSSKNNLRIINKIKENNKNMNI